MYGYSEVVGNLFETIAWVIMWFPVIWLLASIVTTLMRIDALKTLLKTNYEGWMSTGFPMGLIWGIPFVLMMLGGSLIVSQNGDIDGVYCVMKWYTTFPWFDMCCEC